MTHGPPTAKVEANEIVRKVITVDSYGLVQKKLMVANRGFPPEWCIFTILYISCLRYTILVGNP